MNLVISILDEVIHILNQSQKSVSLGRSDKSLNNPEQLNQSKLSQFVDANSVTDGDSRVKFLTSVSAK
jgi:hypothetical protein